MHHRFSLISISILSILIDHLIHRIPDWYINPYKTYQTTTLGLHPTVSERVLTPRSWKNPRFGRRAGRSRWRSWPNRKQNWAKGTSNILPTVTNGIKLEWASNLKIMKSCRIFQLLYFDFFLTNETLLQNLNSSFYFRNYEINQSFQRKIFRLKRKTQIP